MVVKRNKDGSVTIIDDNGNTVIGIGRMVEVSVDKRKEKFLRLVEDCAKFVTACAHTLKETELHFLDQCDALPLATNDRRIKNFQYNVIMNYCKDKLGHQASEFSFDMTDEEIEKWHKEEYAMRLEAMNSSPEQFGLNISGYYLPHTERNEVFYEQDYLEAQKFMKNTNPDPKPINMQNICFFFEETKGIFQSNGGSSLMEQLIVFKGISEDDIAKRSPLFLRYISGLREMGKLPGIRRE